MVQGMGLIVGRNDEHIHRCVCQTLAVKKCCCRSLLSSPHPQQVGGRVGDVVCLCTL